MISKVPFAAAAAVVFGWLCMVGIVFTEALQAWYLHGEMAAIDEVQRGVLMLLFVTPFFALITFFVYFGLKDFLKGDN